MCTDVVYERGSDGGPWCRAAGAAHPDNKHSYQLAGEQSGEFGNERNLS